MIPTAFVTETGPDLLATAAMQLPVADLVEAASSISPEMATAAVTSSNLFVSMCSQLAPTTAVLASAAPLLTLQQLRQQNQGVGNLPLLPYTMLAVNCILWITYGTMQDAATIWMPNVVSLGLAVYYMVSYSQIHNSSSSANDDDMRHQIQQHVSGVGLVALSAGVASHLVPADMVGSAAVCLCIAMLASPLATVQQILREKSGASERIDLSSTLASLVNTGLWTVSGVADLHDIHIILPNVLGDVFGMLQVGLLAKFGGEDSAATTSNAADGQKLQPQREYFVQI